LLSHKIFYTTVEYPLSEILGIGSVFNFEGCFLEFAVMDKLFWKFQVWRNLDLRFSD
jgi:hypothetical protein